MTFVMNLLQMDHPVSVDAASAVLTRYPHHERLGGRSMTSGTLSMGLPQPQPLRA
jgi:hypothetical protein